MAKISTIKTNFGREKQRFFSRKTEIFGGLLHAPATQFFSAVGFNGRSEQSFRKMKYEKIYILKQ